MVPQLAKLMSTLEARTEEFLGEIAAMSPEQQRFRPGGEAWSPVMVAHHVALFEAAVAGSLAKREAKGRRKRKRGLKQALLFPVVNLVLRTGIKVKVPTRRGDPDPELDLEAVRGFWTGARDSMRASLEAITVDELGDEAWRHPVAGPVDFREGLAMAVDHLDHHQRQIERIRRSPGFPAPAP